MPVCLPIANSMTFWDCRRWRAVFWATPARAGLFRQSVFGRLAGYEDVNDADRLRHDPAMRWVVGVKATSGAAASPSQIGRFETQWLAADKEPLAVAGLLGEWVCPG